MDIQLANQVQPLVVARVGMTTRIATMDDLPFIDRLQKKHSRQVGFFRRAQMEGYIKPGWVLLALNAAGNPIGYCASRDRYQKRDELGVIFQMCVDDTIQRKLVGAMLLKSVFERSAYGTRLYSCWCAQDLAANYFWEACGFVPLAFRTGSRERGTKGGPRVHIFWQKRIREGDATTPWWFPSQTGGGAIGEDRLVLPIPPGVRWCDPMPILLPGEEEEAEVGGQNSAVRKIAGPRTKPNPTANLRPVPAAPRTIARPGGMHFVAPPAPAPVKEKSTPAPKADSERPRKVKAKVDPKYVAAARELRDRWLEKVSENPMLLASNGKYDVARAIGSNVSVVSPMLQLPHAA